MVVKLRRLLLPFVCAICAAAGSTLVAQTSASADAVALDALTKEFTARRAPGGDGRVPGVLPTAEQMAADAAWADGLLTRLHALHADRLTHDQWITYATLDWQAGILKEYWGQYPWFDIPITPYNSPLRGFPVSFASLPMKTEADVTAYVDALNRVPMIAASYETRLRSQMARDIVAPSEELRLTVPFVRGLAAPPSESRFRPQSAQLASLPEDMRPRAAAQIDAAIVEAVNPSFERLAAFIDGPYRAKAPAGVGAAQYPGGRAYYQFLIRDHTALNLTPEEIHAIGLAEVDRLEKALDQVRRDAGFTGTLAEFHAYLRNDPRFRATSAEDIGDRMMKAITRIEPQIGEFFPIKPKAPYGVKRLDPALEASMTYGYYQDPSKRDPGGYYNFNGSHPQDRSILMAEATIYHELIPGHHFQIALQEENESLNAYRRNAFFTAFTEGWAEYASDLAGEMGMYSDPYARAGRLAMDLFLSTRLVIDTGMNALGWSREKGMAYMREHTFESDLQIDTETLRYSSDTPGQALAYKLGAREFHQLRDRLEKEQGSTFDLRAFHAWVLRAGNMPLTVLDGHVACFAHERHVASGSR